MSTDTLKMDSWSIVVPEGWQVKENCLENDCSLLSPQENGQDTFLENINITLAKAPSKDYPTEKYADFSVGYLPSVIQDFILIERKKTAKNTIALIYKGIKSNYEQTWYQTYTIKGNNLYILTLSAETAKFKNYLEEIQSTFASLEIK